MRLHASGRVVKHCFCVFCLGEDQVFGGGRGGGLLGGCPDSVVLGDNFFTASFRADGLSEREQGLFRRQ